MKRLEQMKESLIACVQNQIAGHLDQVDTKELGEAIDMIKDLEEAIYYCTITKAMHEREDEPRQQRVEHYPTHYAEGGHNQPHSQSTMYYDGDVTIHRSDRSHMREDSHMPMDMRYMKDAREGTSPMYRKMYMESKELNHDNAKTMQELEKYIHELSNDVMEMISSATPEEKQVLRQKITTLATKIK